MPRIQKQVAWRLDLSESKGRMNGSKTRSAFWATGMTFTRSGMNPLKGLRQSDVTHLNRVTMAAMC